MSVTTASKYELPNHSTNEGDNVHWVVFTLGIWQVQILLMDRGRIKENNGGVEFNYDIFDIL
jgi:hypothetical protein